MKGRCQSLFRDNKLAIAAEPARQGLARWVVRGKCFGIRRTGIDFALEHGNDQIASFGKTAIERADTHPGGFGNFTHRRIDTRFCKNRLGGF